MKVGDILRKLADAIDSDQEQQSQEQQAQAAMHQQDVEQAKQQAQDMTAGQVAQVVQAANNVKRASEKQADAVAMKASLQAPEPNTHELTPADNTDGTDQATMINPLQQKHELLKKATDTSNDVDKFDDETDANDAELALLKKMAGIENASDQATPDIDPTSLIQIVSDEFDT